MLVYFTDSYFELLFTGEKVAGKPRFPPEVIRQYRLRIVTNQKQFINI